MSTKLGRLNNGGKPCPPEVARRGHKPCKAKRKRDGKPCQSFAMANGCCSVHGGKSTGPKTPEGKERVRQANLKHGRYSYEGLEQTKQDRALLRSLGIRRSSSRTPTKRDDQGRFEPGG